MQKLRTLFIITLVSLFGLSTSATHIIGGSLGYEYVGETFPGSGMYTYKVIMTFYLNCDNSSSNPTFDDLTNGTGTLTVGAYFQDNSDPLADKVKYQDIVVTLVDSTIIVPDLPNNCNVGQGLCTTEGIFEGFVDLPLSFDGYHLYYHLCCRNVALTNVQNPNGTGVGFYSFIPPTLVNNSAPAFTGEPTPFLCTNDTTTFLNTAIDPDGDQLIFSFVTPLNYVQGAGFQPPPPPVLPFPIPEINYVAGYSAVQPFGAGGYAFIDGSTGLTEYMSPNQGNFIVGVEIKEFRNGQLIGVSRRDLQLQVIVCPPNDSPDFDSGQLIYEIDEGESLCFNIEFSDPDGDSLWFDASGVVFDTNFVNPPATIMAPDSGLVINSQFCWDTECGQGQALPYLFVASATDNGCPPKTTDVVYEITVNPTPEPGPITGPDLVCSLDSGLIYFIDTVPDVTGYLWTITGGTITSDSTGVQVTVNWDGPGIGTLSVITFNGFGCSAAPSILNVTIGNPPIADAGSDTLICPGDTVMIGGSPTGPPGSIFAWFPSAGLNDSTLANPLAFPDSSVTYYVSVSDGNGCANVDTMNIVISTSAVDAGPDVSICIGDTVQLSASGGDTYSWSPDSSLSDGTIPDPLAFPVVTSEYIVTITDTLGCSNSDTVIVTVNPLPFVDAGLNITMCPSDSVVLGGSPTGPPGSIYSWDNAATLNDSTLSNPVADPLTTTQYIVIVTDTNGCVNSDTTNVTVNPLPPVDAGPDASICIGDSTQLAATGNGLFSWSPITELSDPNIADPMAGPTVTTMYVVTLTDTITGCMNMDTVIVTVFPLPTVNAGADVQICFGDTAQLLATGGLIYSWSPNINLSDPNIFDPLAWPTDTTTYYVTVTDTNTCVNIDSVMVIVNPLPFADAGPDTIVCNGNEVVIGGSPTGPTGSLFAWDNAATLNDSTLANPGATPIVDPTLYTVLVTDTNGCMASDDVLVSIYALPPVDAGADATICLDDSTQLSATGTGVFSWDPIDGLSDPNIADPMASPAITTQYIVTLTDANVCVNTDTLTVFVNPLPLADAGADVVICIGDTTQLFASGGSIYSWTPNDSLSDPNIADPLVWTQQTTMYYVSVTDTNTCVNTDSVLVTVNALPIVDAGPDQNVCEGSSVTIGGSPTGPAGSTFSWSVGGILDDPNAANPVATPVVDLVEVVTVTDGNNCVNTDSMMLFVDPLPFLEAGVDTSICLNDSVQLNAQGNGTFSWTPPNDLSDPNIADPWASPSSGTQYIVTLTDTNSCVNIDTIFVSVNPLPTATASDDVWLCPGDSTQLTASGGDNYIWLPTQGLSNPNIADPMASPAGTVTYTVLVIDANGCTDTDDVEVVVNDDPPTDAGPDQLICDGESIVIGGSPTTSASGSSFLWVPNNGTLDDETLANPTAGPLVTTTYVVTVSNDTCTNSDAMTVFVGSNATPDFDIFLTATCDGLLAEFVNNSTGAVEYLWDFGDGTTSDTENPTHNYTYGQDITVTLTAISSDGCSTSLQQTLTVDQFEDYIDIIVPNVFTPNGDGVNDTFTIGGDASIGACTEMSIYNRWGQLQFTSSGNNITWDGRTVAGVEATEGTYFYHIVVNGMEFKGSVSLMRVSTGNN